jgi:putative (di)nucleoside polyphosphate hydrolase
LRKKRAFRPSSSRRIAECPERLKYDLPPELQGRLWGGKWKGQLQDWYLARFLGDDSDVNIATKHPEFNDWKWVEPDELPDLDRPLQARPVPAPGRRVPPVFLSVSSAAAP